MLQTRRVGVVITYNPAELFELIKILMFDMFFSPFQLIICKFKNLCEFSQYRLNFKIIYGKIEALEMVEKK